MWANMKFYLLILKGPTSTQSVKGSSLRSRRKEFQSSSAFVTGFSLLCVRGWVWGELDDSQKEEPVWNTVVIFSFSCAYPRQERLAGLSLLWTGLSDIVPPSSGSPVLSHQHAGIVDGLITWYFILFFQYFFFI